MLVLIQPLKCHQALSLFSSYRATTNTLLCPPIHPIVIQRWHCHFKYHFHFPRRMKGEELKLAKPNLSYSLGTKTLLDILQQISSWV